MADQKSPAAGGKVDRITRLEEKLGQVVDRDCYSEWSPDCPAELRESHLQDILAFESIQSGPSLFQGLQERGLELPHPKELNERQSAEKVGEILMALIHIQVFVVGLDQMTPGEAYSKLWHETLWEGCYVEKRTPGAITLVDASHKLSRSDVKDSSRQGTTVH
jgi:hypothetical protein